MDKDLRNYLRGALQQEIQRFEKELSNFRDARWKVDSMTFEAAVHGYLGGEWRASGDDLLTALRSAASAFIAMHPGESFYIAGLYAVVGEIRVPIATRVSEEYESAVMREFEPAYHNQKAGS